MRFEQPPSAESRDADLVGRLATSAKELAKTFEWPHNVYKALDALNIKDAKERSAYFAKTAAELKRRKRIERLSADAASSEASKYEAEERGRESRED